MSEHPESLDHYNAAWNERDVSLIRGHLDRAVTPDVVFADPANRIAGVDALEGLIRTARTELPAAQYRLASEIDGGHDHRWRYHWDVFIDGSVVFVGTDVTTTRDDGLIERIDGFFNDLPRTR